VTWRAISARPSWKCGTPGQLSADVTGPVDEEPDGDGVFTLVGRCRLTASNPVLELESAYVSARFLRLKLQYDETLSNVAFNFNLRRYTLGTFGPNDSSDEENPPLYVTIHGSFGISWYGCLTK
jgi:hypothetical protein